MVPGLSILGSKSHMSKKGDKMKEKAVSQWPKSSVNENGVGGAIKNKTERAESEIMTLWEEGFLPEGENNGSEDNANFAFITMRNIRDQFSKTYVKCPPWASTRSCARHWRPGSEQERPRPRLIEITA